MTLGEHCSLLMLDETRDAILTRMEPGELWTVIEGVVNAPDDVVAYQYAVKLGSKAAQKQAMQLRWLHRAGRLPPPPQNAGSPPDRSSSDAT